MSSSKPTAKRQPAAKPAARSSAKPGKAAAKPAKPAASVASIVSSAEAVSAQMTATAAAMEKQLAAGDLANLPIEPLQKLMAAAVKAYSAKREAGEKFLPVSSAGRVTPTDIMLTSSQLLRAGNLQVFELGMWQSWTGN